MIETSTMYDLLEKRSPDYHPLAYLLSHADRLKLKLFISSTTLSKIHDRLLEEKSVHESTEILRQMLQLAKVVAPDYKVWHKALHASFKNLAFALEFFTADSNKIDFLISNQQPEKKNRKLPVLSAGQFLSIIKPIVEP